MKTKYILLSSLFLAFTAALSAQSAEKEEREKPTPEGMLEKFDANNSGALELNEIETAFEERKAKIEERIQKMKERRQERGGPEERASMVIERFDIDGDGNLSEEEIVEMFSTMKEKGPRGKGGRGGPPQE
ncbi:MAG: EF-hand domain-containing protein [Verrucomicrobiota bacterium]